MIKGNIAKKIFSIIITAIIAITVIPIQPLKTKGAVSAIWPVPSNYQTITTHFDERRNTVNPENTDFHNAMDIYAPSGTDIYAVYDGTVEFSGVKESYGNFVVLYHQSLGVYTFYAHASSLVVKQGASVKKGDVIAKVGSTGNSSGSHLHYGVCSKIEDGWPRRTYYDPETYFIYDGIQNLSSAPRIENARITQITSKGYIVQCEVYDEVNPVTRVAFPTWTTKTDSSGRDQDDIIWADGSISGATATFEVKISDHNNELGYYRTHIYCYNSTGSSSSVALPDICVENTEPSIYNVKIAAQTSNSYTIQCDVNDNDSGIDRVQFPTWTTANGQDDLKVDWGTNKSLCGTIDGNTVTYTVNISDHNNELGEYETHIYAYDKSGNYSALGVKVNIEDTPPKITDVKIISQTSTSYTVQCKVEDSGSGVDRVQFPTWTAENDQDDIVENWGISEKVRGSLDNGIATFTVHSSEHNNELGIYYTHIYAYDKCGNYVSVGVTVNLGVYKLSVNPNGGMYDNSTSITTKEHILKYGYSYWGNIGEGEYGNASRNGYILKGYYDKPEGGIKVYDSNGIALDTDYFTNLTYFGDSDLTVYAQWEAMPETTTTTTSSTKITTTTKTMTTTSSNKPATTTKATTTTSSTKPATTTKATTSSAELSLEETEVTLAVGEQFEIKANQSELCYESSDKDIASVSKTGVITAKKPGDVFIFVTNADEDAVVLKVKVITAEKVVYGDANNDGKVSVADAVAILQSLGNRDKYALTVQGQKNADVDGIAGITGKDALVIQQVDAGIYKLEDLPLKAT